MKTGIISRLAAREKTKENRREAEKENSGEST